MKKSGIRNAALSVAAASALILAASPQAGAVTVTVGDATIAAGQDGPIDVTLQTMGSSVAGTQNDLQYPSGATIGVVAGSNGRPMCAVNPAIGKEGTAFSFQPPQCTAGTTCTGVRALVLSLSNVDPIPDGSVLYTCTWSVAAGTDAGSFELNTTNVGASDPDGNALPATGVAGTLTVGGGPAAATIHVGSATGQPGGVASFDVTLETGVEVAGTQNDIGFTPDAAIQAGSNGRPLCAVNPAIMKEGTAFSFQPPQCTVGTTCTAIRSLVLSLSNVDAIPSGSTLYNCQVAIEDTATVGEDYALTCSNAGASDPAGNALTTDCTDGKITVEGGATPTPTITTVPTSGATNTPTATHTSAATPTRTQPTVVPGNDCDDGCAITAPAQSQTGWLLLVPAAMLIWLRRRSR